MPSGTKLVIKNVPHRKRAWTNQLEFMKKSVIPALKKVDYSFLFWVKVNTKDFPTYPNIVKCPMDFSVIENRLKEHYYESAKDCIRDINLVFANCYIFSQAGEDITLIGEHMLRDKFLKKMQDFPQEEMPLERKKRGPVRKRAPQSPADDSDGHLSARRHSLESVDSHSNPAFITDGSEISPGNGEAKGRNAIISRISKDPDQPARREREARPQMSMSLNAVSTITPVPEAKPRIKLIPSLNRCLKIVNDLLAYRRRRFNWPFLEPVDPVSLKLPDYFQVVKQPMDLLTIKKGLESGSYTHKSQVKEHIDLMLANCYLYNGHDSMVAECGRNLGAFFEKKFTAIPDDLELQQGAASAGKKHKHHKHHKAGKRSKLDLLPDDVEKINVVTQQLQEVVERMSGRCAELDRLSRVITAYDESYPAPLSTESFMRQIHTELRSLPSLNGQRAAGRPRKRSMAAEVPLKRKRPRVNGKEEEEEEEELSYEEKEALSQALQRVTDANLLNELGAIVQRFEPQVQSASSGELNVDLTALNNSTLMALRRAMETRNAQGTTVQPVEEALGKAADQEEEEEGELELEMEMEGEKEEVEKAPRGRRNRKAVNPVRNRGVPTVLTAAPEPPVPAPVLPVEEPVASTSAAPPPTTIEEEVVPAQVASPQPTASSSAVPVPEKLPPVLEPPPPPIIMEQPPEQPVSLPPVIRKGERETRSGEPSQNHRSPLPAPPKPEEVPAPPKLESSTPVRRRSSSLAILSSDENDYVSNRSDSEDDHEKESPTKSDDEFKGPPLVSQQCPRRSVYDIFNDDKADSKRRNAKSKEEMGLMDIQSTYKALILQNKTDMLTKEVQRDLATKERREEEERRKREDEERKRREEKAKEARKEALKEQERKRLNEIRARNRRADMPLRQYADMANFEKKLDFSLLSPRWV